MDTRLRAAMSGYMSRAWVMKPDMVTSFIRAYDSRY